MAVINNFALKGARGKVGNVVFATWKGLDVVKAHQTDVSNPQTELQTLNRTKFKILSFLAASLLLGLRNSIKNISSSMSEYNYFVKKSSEVISDVFTPISLAQFRLLPFSINNFLFDVVPTIENKGDSVKVVFPSNPCQRFGADTVIMSFFAIKADLSSALVSNIVIHRDDVDLAYEFNPEFLSEYKFRAITLTDVQNKQYCLLQHLSL